MRMLDCFCSRSIGAPAGKGRTGRYRARLTTPAREQKRICVGALVWRCPLLGAWRGRLGLYSLVHARPRDPACFCSSCFTCGGQTVPWNNRAVWIEKARPLPVREVLLCARPRSVVRGAGSGSSVDPSVAQLIFWTATGYRCEE